MIAEQIYYNGCVYTVDENDTIVEAVAVKDGKILYAGDESGAKALSDKDTEWIDLNGGMMLPSFVDAHSHPLHGAVPAIFEIPLTGVQGKEALLATIKEFVVSHPEQSVYTGLGFDRNGFDETGLRKEWLDDIVSDRPMILTSLCGHSVWVNSKTLELANITAETTVGDGGVICKDPKTGQPTGTLDGVSAIDLVNYLMPEYSLEQCREAGRWVQELFLSNGVTVTYDAYLDATQPNYPMAYQKMAEDGELHMRIRGGWHVYPTLGTNEDIRRYVKDATTLSESFDTEYFKTESLKFVLDGIIEDRTAFMLEPLEDDRNDFGEHTWETERLSALVEAYDKDDWQMHFHCDSDGSFRQAIDVMENAQRKNGKKDRRPCLAHCVLATDEDIDRLADLNGVAIMAPHWAILYPEFYKESSLPVVGSYRANSYYPQRSIYDKGVCLAYHSDYYVSEPDMGLAMFTGLTRQMPKEMFDDYYEDTEMVYSTEKNPPVDGKTVGPLKPYEEVLTLPQLFRMFTINGAKAHHLENICGSIEVGKSADFVLYEKNLLKLPAEELTVQKPYKTIFEGKCVFEKAKE